MEQKSIPVNHGETVYNQKGQTMVVNKPPAGCYLTAEYGFSMTCASGMDNQPRVEYCAV